MVDWSKITEEEKAVIVKIAERFEKDFTPVGYKRINLLMDMEAAHLVCPMDLNALLASDDATFNHDLNGIARHINRTTGELERCFVPRTARREEATNAGH